MAKINWTQLSADAGGRWLGNPVAYFWLAPIWLVLSVLLTPGLNDAKDWVLAVLVNVFSLSLCAAIFAFFIKVPFKNRSARPIRLGFVIATGGLIGLVKGLSTAVLYWLFNPSFDLLSSLPGKVLSVTFFGMWILPAITIAYATLARYREERALLIAEIVRRESHLRRQTPSGLDHISSEEFTEVTEFIRTTRGLLSAREAQSDRALPDALTSLVDGQLRPLSHRMWQNIDTRISDFSFRDLARLMFRENLTSPLATTVIFDIIMAAPQIFATGIGEGLARLLVQSAIIFIVLFVAKLSPRRGETWGWIVFVAMNLVATSAIFFVCTWLFGNLPGLSGPVVYFMLLNVLGLTTLMLGIVRAALQSRDAIRRQLNEFAHEKAHDLYQSAQSQLDRRELAHYLHGHVQNRLLSAALRIRDSDPESAPSLIEDELSEIRTILDDLEARRWSLSNRNLTEELEHIGANWNGLISLDIDANTIGALALEASMRDAIAQVVNEAITNAVRHGMATKVNVMLRTSAERELTLTCVDNGTGPGHGSAGLGSTLFTSVAGARWALTPRANHAGSQLSVDFGQLT